MGSLKFHLLLALIPIAHTILLSHPVFSDDEIDHPSTFDEEGLVEGLNSHRQGLKLTPLVKNVQAECLADYLPDLELNGRRCGTTAALIYEKAIPVSSGQPFSDYQQVILKCNIDANHTAADWMILPVCVPKLDPKSVLSEYTQDQSYGKYLKDPKFAGIGVESIDDWVVVVLSTNTPQGSAASGRAAPPPASGATSLGSPAGGATPATPQGSTATPQGSRPSSGALGMVSEMKSGVYLMAFLLSIGLLLTS